MNRHWLVGKVEELAWGPIDRSESWSKSQQQGRGLEQLSLPPTEQDTPRHQVLSVKEIYYAEGQVVGDLPLDPVKSGSKQ